MNLKRASGLLLIVIILSALLAPPYFSQSKEKKRPKLKDFGSSLDGLKWDPVKRQSVETKQRRRSSGASTDDIVQIETNLVTSDILVVDDKGKLVSDLTAGDFLITEDNQPQEVGHFSRGDNASVPRTIVLIIDYSCTQLPVLRRSIDAAKLLVDKLGPADSMAIVTDDIELIVDFTNDKSKLKKKLESVYERPNTLFDPTVVTDWHTWGKGLQYSALMATLKEAFIEEDLRPIIIFQTDGREFYYLRDSIFTEGLPPDLPDDFRAELQKEIDHRTKFVREHRISDFSLEDLYRAAEKSRATIYTVVPALRFLNRSPEQQMKLMSRKLEASYARAMSESDYWGKRRLLAKWERWRTSSAANLTWWAQQEHTVQDALAAVAPRTGGWTEFLETPEDADGIYDRILADISHRYILGYYPTNKAHDGSRRKIKFAVRGHPEYYILGRVYYYAPADE